MDDQVIVENEQALSIFANGEMTDEAYAAHPPLERVLQQIQSTGILYYDWTLVRGLLLYKVKAALQAYDANGLSLNEEINRDELFATITSRDAPPFTLQRLVEVLLQPTLYYHKSAKFLNAVYKFFEVSTNADIDDPRDPHLVVAMRQG
ncbi:unnamed protein product [Aphanomyces euteiches]|uniref:Uncharacterized protein n=1 Tax=Aphanomyces euteiches TaxID=100861 RepID=A0A6G0WDB2_9STRA|nr:hypothetical protein Ae201684_016716 [Aphanomyces euteiches]KAH9083099.1 hypothetical protein Ae201684P_013998 [Aphanomyces euteiches]KAH9089794.1 hypothetical protein LEN26_019036 [Aphanomyces euteiches]KAH9116351.1 hypothetical protein AeMF1_009713 [Aphanomyces euteiches]KAH9157765.1 hypothetical protein AeRB84_000402 [Aphanomyces euteiches]